MVYDKIVNEQKQYFLTDITKNYYFRLKQLKSLKLNIIKYEKEIVEAIYLDLGKSKGESFITEYSLVIKELNFHIKNLCQL